MRLECGVAMVTTRLSAALLLLLITSSFTTSSAKRIGQAQTDTTSHNNRRMQDELIDATTPTIITDIPVACQGWKEDKIQECIAEQTLLASILSSNNLESIPAECAGLNTDKLGDCLSMRQTILDQNGVTTIPSGCQGLGVDKLEECIVEHNLVETLLSQNNLNSIPAECAELNSDKLGACLSLRQTILDQNGVTTIPSGCRGLQVNKLEECIVENKLAQTILSQYSLDSIPFECAGLNSDKLGECLSLRQTIMDQQDVTTIPDMCQGLGVDKLEDCLINYNTVQSILTANKIEDIPADCAGVEEADKLAECVHQWRLTQIILGVSQERIPPECIGMEKENNLEKCLEEFTLAPTNYPTYMPTLGDPTYMPTLNPATDAPTVWSTDVPTGAPVEWNSYSALNNLEGEKVSVPIGRFAMSVTKHVNHKEKWNSDRRVLQKHNNGKNPRKYELDATRDHIREVYEAEFHLPVARIDLHFVDNGETKIGLKADGTSGAGIMRHSVFFGNVMFVVDSENENEAGAATTYPVPTEEQLDEATINAFTGERKQAFIEKYHYRATGKKYFGIKYSYDVNVRKSLVPDVELSTSTSVQPAESIVPDQDEATGESSLGTTFIVLILLGGVLLGTLIGVTAVVIRRKRSDRAEKKLQSRVIKDGFFMDDEPDALGSRIGFEIEHGDDMLHVQSAVSSNNHRIQSSIPIVAKSFEDSVSQLASDDDTVHKDIEKETREVDSGESTKEVDSGDSDCSPWSYSPTVGMMELKKALEMRP